MVPNGQLNGPGHPGCFTLVHIHPHTFAHIHSSATMACCLWSVPSCTDPGACAYKLTCFFQIKTALVFAHVADCLDTFSSFSFPLLSLTVTNKNWACIFYSWFTFSLPSWHQAERFLLERLMFLFRYFSWPFLNGNILFYNFQTGVTRLLVVFLHITVLAMENFQQLMEAVLEILTTQMQKHQKQAK